MAKVYLTRRLVFSASHRLHSDALSARENLEVFGKCNGSSGHGHNYELFVTIKGELDPKSGMLFNLSEMKDILAQEIESKVDHKHLNLDVPEFKGVNPTAENMAVVFWRILEKRFPKGLLYEVKVQETENNVAVYRGE